jgi:hypothetical protein
MRERERERKTYIYATVYNNVNRIASCLKSITPLGDIIFVIVDNYSTDGTYELLKKIKFKNLKIILMRTRCSRGKGRNIGLNIISKIANDNDKILYIDLDTVYTQKWISLVLSTKPKDNTLYYGFLSKLKVQKTLPWSDLNFSEDWERMARAKSRGIRLIGVNKNMIGYMENERIENGLPRENRYGGYLRRYKNMISCQRGMAYKSWQEFYDSAESHQNIILDKLIWISSYFIAQIKGVYSYDKNLDNFRFVMKGNKLSHHKK